MSKIKNFFVSKIAYFLIESNKLLKMNVSVYDCVFIRTIVADWEFSSLIKNFIPCVSTILSHNIDDMDDSFVDRANLVLFGEQNDKKLFKFLSLVEWDFIEPVIIPLPYRFRNMFCDLDLDSEYLIQQRLLMLAGDVESNPGPIMSKLQDTVELVKHLPKVVSYNEVMTILKPVVTITGLFNIYTADDMSAVFAETIKLMEAHELYWSLDMDKLTTCIDCLLTLVKNIKDVPELIKSFVPGEDRYSQSPSSGILTSETLNVNDDGMISKALKFGQDFGISESLIKSGGPIVALLSTSVAALALIGCGSKISTNSISPGLSNTIHGMATECRDWKVLLSSFEDTWKFIANYLGKFLGFTYMDDKMTARTELANRLEQLQSDVERLESTKEIDYDTVNDPKYFENFQLKIKTLDKLLSDMIKSDSNLSSFKITLDKLKEKVDNIKDEFTTLFQSKCGKQQPTTMWVGSPKSGIGKTTFIEHMTEMLSLHYGRNLTKYVKNFEEAYWSNYCYQDIVHGRDFGQSKTETEHIELINIYDPSTSQLNMSDNNQKGRQFKSKYFLIDSNQLYIRRSAMIQDATKLDRRRDFLFAADTTYLGTANQPTPTKEEALAHLVLRSLCPLGEGALPAHLKPEDFVSVYYTIDGRTINSGGKDQVTRKFTEIAQQLFDHEQRNCSIYREKCIRIYKEEQARKVLSSQVGEEPAVSVIDSKQKKIVVLLGEPGCGKTTLARKHRKIEDTTQDEFVFSPNMRERMLKSFDIGNEDLILTCNYRDLQDWKDALSYDQKLAIDRRCIYIDCKFAPKPINMFQPGIFGRVYYTAKDVEDNPSDYTKMVHFYVNNQRMTYCDVDKLILENMNLKVDEYLQYRSCPHIKVNLEMCRNLVNFDLKWSDMDEVQAMPMISLMQKITVVRSEFSLPTLLKSFSKIVRDVFRHYEVKQNLEDGLTQLNSLRIDSPLVFDCVVKLQDEAFFLTTDDANKLVFCICDDSFEYSEQDGKIFCYLEKELMWEETGRVGAWYRHILRNVEKVTIDYTNFTPPSRNLISYCDHFLNFVKTTTAGLVIYKLCNLKPKLQSERMFDTYDLSMTKKPPTMSDFVMKPETSADAYLQRSGLSVPKTKRSASNWTFKQNYKTTRNDYYDSESAVDIAASEISEIVMKQNYPVKVNNKRIAFAQGVFRNILVTVGHITNDVKIEINGIDYFSEVIAVDNERDLAILCLPEYKVSFRDIRKYYQLENVGTSLTGYPACLYTWSNDRTIIREKPILLREQREQMTTTGLKNGIMYNVNSYGHVAPIQTTGGFCGSPLIIVNPAYQRKLLGLHVAADTAQGLSSVIFSSDFDFAITSEVLESETIEVLPFQQVVLINEQLPKKFSPNLTLIGKPGNMIDGKFKVNVIHSSDKTQIHPSPFQMLEDSIFEPAVLSNTDSRLEVPEMDILVEGINKFGRVQPDIDINILDEVVEEVSDMLVKIIEETQLRTKVFSVSEAINGCSYYETSPSINMSSGCGYPHNFEFGNITKSNMFEFNEQKNRYFISDKPAGKQLKEDLHTYLDYLKNTTDTKTAVVYVAQKKDEVRKIEKIVTGSTRVFEMGPTYHFMAMKMYFGASQALYSLTNSLSPFKIGINASSYEFKLLYKYLAKTGTKGMNGDYKGFDTSHPRVYLQRYSKIDNNVYRATDPDWKIEDDHMRIRLHQQEEEPLVLVDGLIVKCPGGLMSGGEDTGGKNNKAGAINMRYAWKVLAKKYAPNLYYKYDLYTTDAFFGDDLVKTISDDVISWYHPQSIKAIVESIGFTITSADKQEELKIKDLSELSFLKRNFNNVEIIVGGQKHIYMVGALEDSCFDKMLNWCKTSKRYHYNRQAPVFFDPATIGLTALTCLSEASLKGKDFFDGIKRHIKTCAKDHNIILPTLPNFNQAFYETYFKSEFPEQKQYKPIDILVNNELSPIYPKAFVFRNKTFEHVMHCFEYWKADLHCRNDTRDLILSNPKQYIKHANSYTTNASFKPSNLMRKIIHSRFSNFNFTLEENEQYIAKFPHSYFGYTTPTNCNNVYGLLLTEYAKTFKNCITVTNGDLFKCPESYSMAHCVAEDMRMGKGIALTFKTMFGKTNELSDQQVKQGGVAVLENNDRFIYYLVTKTYSSGKPTLLTLRQSLESMKLHAKKNNIENIAMPLIGCGLDKLKWEDVEYILHQIFNTTGINIHVYKNIQDVPEPKDLKLISELKPIYKRSDQRYRKSIPQPNRHSKTYLKRIQQFKINQTVSQGKVKWREEITPQFPKPSENLRPELCSQVPISPL